MVSSSSTGLNSLAGISTRVTVLVAGASPFEPQAESASARPARWIHRLSIRDMLILPFLIRAGRRYLKRLRTDGLERARDDETVVGNRPSVEHGMLGGAVHVEDVL